MGGGHRRHARPRCLGETAGKARAAFNGNPAVIREAQALLEHRGELTPVTVLQLERVLLNAAEGPMTNPQLVADRIEAETKQASVLNSFVFKLNGKPITANEIDDLLHTNRDLAERQAVWEASKQSGPALKPGLGETPAACATAWPANSGIRTTLPSRSPPTA